MRSKTFKKFISAGIALAFLTLTLFPYPAYAQTVLGLPRPGTMVSPTPGFQPVTVRGLTIHPDNALQFNFILDMGQQNLEEEALKAESSRLIKYFLAALTVPEDDLWVNLSPYEKDRIIAEGFGETELGRDMLAQDYLLKQLTASLMYPEKDLGRAFWQKVYQKAYEQFGTADIPVNTFNKVWILPEKAVVYEKDASAYILESRLKVMMEEDYLAREAGSGERGTGLEIQTGENTLPVTRNPISVEIIKQILLPEIEREVNEGETFAPLRQMYHAMILAHWYKQNLKESLLGKVYIDQKKITGVDVEDREVKLKIYNQYLEAYKKGVYNYIREDVDPVTQKLIPRKYFSGGTKFASSAMNDALKITNDPAQARIASSAMGDHKTVRVTAALAEAGEGVTRRAALQQLAAAAVGAGPNTGRGSSALTEEMARQTLLRIQKLGEQIEKLIFNDNEETEPDETKSKYQYAIAEPSIEFGDSPFSNLKTGTIYFTPDFLNFYATGGLTDDEMTAIIGHEIAHNRHRDHIPVELMVRLVNNNPKKFEGAFNLYKKHQEIEADKHSFRFLDQLGINRQTMITALEKFDAWAQDLPVYQPRADTTEIRLSVLRDRAQDPDDLTDFYTTFSGPGVVRAFGFRSKTRNDLSQAHERVEDILNVYMMINEILSSLSTQQDEKLLDTVEKIFKKKTEDLESKGAHISDSRKSQLQIGFDIAFLDYVIDNLLLNAEGNPPSAADKEKRYYYDLFKRYQSNLTTVFEQILDKQFMVGPNREPSRNYEKGIMTPRKKPDSLDPELPYQFYSKFLRSMLPTKYIIRDGKRTLRPRSDDPFPKILRRVLNQISGGPGAGQLKNDRGNGREGPSPQQNPVSQRSVTEHEDTGESVVKQKPSGQDDDATAVETTNDQPAASEEDATNQKGVRGASGEDDNYKRSIINVQQTQIIQDTVRVRDAPITFQQHDTRDKKKDKRRRWPWWLIPLLFLPLKDVPHDQQTPYFYPEPPRLVDDASTQDMNKFPDAYERPIISSPNTFGSKDAETATHYPANQHPVNTPEAFDTGHEALRDVALALKKILTLDMWNGLIGLKPQSVKVRGQPKAINQEDVRYYIRWFYSIKRGQTTLNEHQINAIEAGVMAFQKKSGLVPDADVGDMTRWDILRAFAKLYSNGVFMLQQPEVLTDKGWNLLKDRVKKVPLIMLIGDQPIVINDGKTVEFYRKTFQAMDPFREPATLEEKISERVAMEAFADQENISNPRDTYSNELPLRAQERFEEEVITDKFSGTANSPMGERLQDHRNSPAKTSWGSSPFSIKNLTTTLLLSVALACSGGGCTSSTPRLPYDPIAPVVIDEAKSWRDPAQAKKRLEQMEKHIKELKEKESKESGSSPLGDISLRTYFKTFLATLGILASIQDATSASAMPNSYGTLYWYDTTQSPPPAVINPDIKRLLQQIEQEDPAPFFHLGPNGARPLTENVTIDPKSLPQNSIIQPLTPNEEKPNQGEPLPMGSGDEFDFDPNSLPQDSIVKPVLPAQPGSSPMDEASAGSQLDPLGGIDFNPAHLDMQIRRDGNGVPLPVSQQPIETMRIEGFVPVIINITPVPSFSQLLGLSEEGEETPPARLSRLSS